MIFTLVLSQLKTLFWKQGVNLRRGDLSSALAVVILPSVLILLASTSSGNISESNSLELVECKIDNLLYCNYPMKLEFESDGDSLNTTSFQLAASNVAKSLGSGYEELFQVDEDLLDPTSKFCGVIKLDNSTSSASAVWSFGKNTVFEEMFLSKFNEELSSLKSDIRFAAINNPYAYEGGGGSLDLRIGTFLLLIQVIGNQITNEKVTNMYYYTTRVGLLPSVFWLFQYLYWMILTSISIGVAALFGLVTNNEIQVGAYFAGAWFHIALAVLIGSIFTNKKFVNMTSFFFLIIGIVIPIVFSSMEQTPQIRNIYDGFKYIPIFFFLGDITSDQINVGCIISAGLTILSFYLAPLFTVSEGMYKGSRVNFFYFLSPKFWTQGIVALPKHEDESVSKTSDSLLKHSDDENSYGEQFPPLMFDNCIKCFGEEKTIGPMNLKLEQGKITTLLGPNGVGKSTLMRVAAGYYIPSAGEIMFEGTNVFRERPWSSLKSISLCPQDNYIYENMTVDEHMLLICSFRDMSRIDDDVESHITWILTTLDIVQKRSTLAKNLSGGMKRRLCLAMSTVGFPQVILCDEPSSGVDSISQRGIWKLLETAKQKSAILLTSHSALESVILSDSVVMMKGSEDITQTKGLDGLTFALKDVTLNTTEEYEIHDSNKEDVADLITSIPNDGSEWKISSKNLSGEALPSLEEFKKKTSEDKLSTVDDDDIQTATSATIPETYDCETPSSWRQIFVLMSVLTLYHADRLFFIGVFGLGLNAGQIFLASVYPTFGHTVTLILTPLVPMIAFTANTIILVQIAEMLASEKQLGVSKLLFSSGITRFSYLMSYIILYGLLSFPVSFALLASVGSIHGTAASIFAIFCIFVSFFIFVVGLCAMLGAVLDARTAFIFTLILPYFTAIFGQGSILKTFANSYPGGVGQVMSGLLINDLNQTEWLLYGICIVVNLVLGIVALYIFVLKLGNYNPFAKCCNKNEPTGPTENYHDLEEMVESDRKEGENIFLEGRSIVKAYGVGEKDAASFKALDNVTFTVENGSLLGLVGKSGAGKSTLMDILAGQLSVTSGAMFVEGSRVFPRNISRVVSMCSQLDTIWPEMKIINAVKIFMRCRGYKVNPCSAEINDPYVRYLIDELGMGEMMKKKVKNLSGGQKRRLAFLVSLLGNTKVVLVDEAMTGVDKESRQIMWKILQEEVRLRDRSIVVTSHEMSEIEQYCNAVGILHEGKLVEMGRLDEIKKKWSDSIKLICLLSDEQEVSRISERIKSNHDNILINLPTVDVLDEGKYNRIIATYEINLLDIQNIAGLISTMESELSNSALLYWSIEPQSLDDFVKTKSQGNTLI